MEPRRISITRPIIIRGGGCANRLAGISHEQVGPTDRDGMADAGGKRLLKQWEGVNSPSRFRPYLHQAAEGRIPKADFLRRVFVALGCHMAELPALGL